MKWNDIAVPRGEWESPVYNISNNLGTTYAEFSMQFINPNNQKLDVFFATSSDKLLWSEWKEVVSGDTGFMGDISSETVYFKYKVAFCSESLSTKPYLQSVKFDFLSRLRIENIGDLDARPKLWIRKKSEKGTVRLTNMMNGYELTLTDINKDEEVFLDGENEEIVSSNQSLGTYRYDNHNDNWLDLLVGENYIRGEGDFDLDIRIQSRLLNE